jgi:HPt (histidine-containing phosphotransfer) domain-containing protein
VTEEILPSGKIRVNVKPLLMQLVPTYLLRREDDLTQLQALLGKLDFKSIQSIGHKLAGNAGTYGFHEISRIGFEIEAAAKSQDPVRIEQNTRALADYLCRLEVAPS